VLIIDDDETVRFTVARALEAATLEGAKPDPTNLEVIEANDGESGWVSLVRHEPQLVIADLRMPRVDGLQLLTRLRDEGRVLPVVLLTQRDAPHEARRALQLGAYDQLPKPLDPLELRATLRRALTQLTLDLEHQQLEAELGLARFMVFSSAAMCAVARELARAATLDLSVLIRGPEGSGRRLAARALVGLSRRADKPLVSFDCATAAPSTLDHALFGHPRADTLPRARKGAFRKADGGTLLLAEVAELDASLQAKLVAVMQAGELPVSDGPPRPIDVRVVATTHRELERMVDRRSHTPQLRAARFREDLLARLAVSSLTMPPLSARREDIVALAEHVVRQQAACEDRQPPRLSSSLCAALVARPWPGNVRELRLTLARSMAHCSADELTEVHLERALDEAPVDQGLRRRLEIYERALLEQALQHSGGNRSQAARALQIGRVTLLDKIKKHGL
jgi:DNA-binding NtrC family response regulator